MCATESSAPSLALCLVLAWLGGCAGSSGAPPELASDVAILRELLVTDPAATPIDEVERVATERPVLGASMLESGALPAARDQLTRAREARLATDRGRGWARRLASAYEQRVRGLEQWHRFLVDAASDDELLLESTTVLRRAQVTVLQVGRELDEVVPLAPPREPAGAIEGEQAHDPASEPTGPPRR